LIDLLVLDAITGSPMLPNHFTMSNILATRALEKIAGRAIIKIFRWFPQYDNFPIRRPLTWIGGDCQAKSPHGGQTIISVTSPDRSLFVKDFYFKA